MVTYTKSFRDRLDFPVRLKCVDGDTWSSVALSQASVVSGEDYPVSLDLSQVEITGTLLTLWIAGGKAGVTYQVDLVLATARGRQKHLQFYMAVR